MRDYLPSGLSIVVLALCWISPSVEPRSRMSELLRNAEMRWLLEEVVIAVSPSLAGAARVDEEEEMAKVASNREELEGSFMMVKIVE